MEEESKQTYQTLYLILAILGVITCTGFGGVANTALALVLAGLAIYMMVKIPRGDKKRRTALILFLVATGLQIVFLVIAISSVHNVVTNLNNLKEELDALSDKQAVQMVGGLMASMIFGFASWVVRIIGTVFAFIGYNREKKLAFDQENPEA
ncbi:hypothetical protein [Lacticaseibacillus parakribbianus]|uniref:hypothetical protein n=1 Tax=Lacticaseibacillus parakribbianus TaxID=2970927 RepID=UPI0021CB0379|nr:hypothetical protein [Lacticaseibacillus parakribbianus]